MTRGSCQDRGGRRPSAKPVGRHLQVRRAARARDRQARELPPHRSRSVPRLDRTGFQDAISTLRDSSRASAALVLGGSATASSSMVTGVALPIRNARPERNASPASSSTMISALRPDQALSVALALPTLQDGLLARVEAKNLGMQSKGAGSASSSDAGSTPGSASGLRQRARLAQYRRGFWRIRPAACRAPRHVREGRYRRNQRSGSSLAPATCLLHKIGRQERTDDGYAIGNRLVVPMAEQRLHPVH